MAIRFKTSTPNKLLSAFKKAIDEGHVATWSYDAMDDFTHTSEQWKKSAWLRPKIKEGELVFSIIKPKGQNISSEVYAIYHGRFIETMLRHCDNLFTNADATALPKEDDLVA